MTEPILAVRDLVVDFRVDRKPFRAVNGVNFDVMPGEILALVGESGSGKSVTAMSILGLLPDNATRTGSIRFDGKNLVDMTPKELTAIRGGDISMIFQDPIAALNPVFTIGFQMGEAVKHQDPSLSRDQVNAKSVELLTLVGIPDPTPRLGYYPHQFSGGQCQRIMIAMALAGEPRLLIADEPTTALDVTVQAEVLDVLRRLHGQLGTSIMIITHDMGVVADLADRVVVMRRGEPVETNEVHALFASPRETYTQELLAAVPRFGENTASSIVNKGELVLDIQDLVVEFGFRLRSKFRAVDSVSFQVHAGEIAALVGESGSGKTTIGRCSVGLTPITSGSISVAGVQLSHAKRAQIMEMRKRVGVVFQNPATSLDPRMTIGAIVAEPLRVLTNLRGAAMRTRVRELLDSVELQGNWTERYPREMSGGQLQRVSIARAIALDPRLLIADEPTSALDVSVQAKVLDLFRELQERLGFACLFISHNLAVVDTLCDRVAVMRKGVLVEQGDRETIFRNPQHEYTRRLISSCPVPDPDEQRERREARLAG
ncbi:ABC transporter ATP-binding protein [Paenarthrobacter sp. Z7-10]|uniref:ABC transporter ATP-binding protein n=1 Tax=Paenarthrobacter sp. Z7-10 TaxID=2787635 RepID=UPI0022A956E4|nr:ABC transporter ATP-binding protein [Paenarthrobacter sp. Z7-10]MCZ2401621.1 ABC transporter ATP-binding protein [Paenarthrobacter sp. Z7-10]